MNKILGFIRLEKKRIEFGVRVSTDSTNTQTYTFYAFKEPHRNFMLGSVPSAIDLFLKSSGLTKKAFAKKCGVSVMTIDRTIKREIAGGYASISLLHAAATAAGYYMDPPRLEPKDPKDARFQTA